MLNTFASIQLRIVVSVLLIIITFLSGGSQVNASFGSRPIPFSKGHKSFLSNFSSLLLFCPKTEPIMNISPISSKIFFSMINSVLLGLQTSSQLYSLDACLIIHNLPQLARNKLQIYNV